MPFHSCGKAAAFSNHTFMSLSDRPAINMGESPLAQELYNVYPETNLTDTQHNSSLSIFKSP
ncbi:hypothetical protein PoB_003311600, partial [Plakobranchus ocellatus]